MFKWCLVWLCVSPQFLSEGDQQARQQQEIETLEKTLTLQEKVSGFISRTDVIVFMNETMVTSLIRIETSETGYIQIWNTAELQKHKWAGVLYSMYRKITMNFRYSFFKKFCRHVACVGTLSQAREPGSKGPLNVTEEMIDLAVVDAFILSGGLPCMGINISVDHPYGFFPFFNCVVFHQVWVVLLAIKLKWIKKIKLKLKNKPKTFGKPDFKKSVF